GQIRFGPDGFLYIALGDGGSGGDPQNNGQRLDTLLGKMLRIDVNGGSPYAIPPTNPFLATQNARPEIWSYGLRNPWRFSFDRVTGDMFIADVGQGEWEEINVEATGTAGRNYGWRIMEGLHCYPAGASCN
uniref:PQQ-dependent sugar dehydrogenase n=1 Tax=Listeria monocytogenes TaxID=1639 RepID=UPI0011405058